MDKCYFSYTDFLRVITPDGWHYFEAKGNAHLDQIFDFHFRPQNAMRGHVGVPMRVTGCYRSMLWEKRKGRDGSSQHTFPEHSYGKGRGATDVEPWNRSDERVEVFFDMADALIGTYKRCCFYPLEGFFHSDYRSKDPQRFVCKYQYDAFRGIWMQDGWEYVPDALDWRDAMRERWESFEEARGKV